jgi:hypothetical protein
MRLQQQGEILKKNEKMLLDEANGQQMVQEKSLQVTKYTKSMVQLKCTFRKMLS